MAAGYIAFMVQIIGNTLIIALGALVSLGVPCLLTLRLSAFSAITITARASGKRDLDESMARHKYVWELMLGVPILPIAFAYITTSYYFYVEDEESVLEAVIRGTMVIVGSSIAVAAVGMVVLLSDRRLRGAQSSQLARRPLTADAAHWTPDPYVDEVRSSVQDVD